MTNGVYQLAIIGCGKVAAKHARAVRENRERLSLAAVADSSPERASRFAREQASKPETVKLFSSLTELLGSIKPDIVAITTPSGSHYVLAKEALDAGCHVLIEKPMTMVLEEARELGRLAEQQNRLIVLGHIYRYFPLVGLLKTDLAQGRFGRVLSGDVKVRWGHDQAYYDSAAWRGTWKADGGVLMNQTIHALDLMNWLMGSPVNEVSGRIARLSHNIEAEDYGTAICRLESGAVLTVEGTTNSPPPRQAASFYILTEKAEIEAGLRKGKPYLKITDMAGGQHQGTYIRRQLQLTLREGLGGLKRMAHPHSAIYHDFIRCLDTGEKPLADAQSGISSVENILAIYRSAKNGSAPQTLPLPAFSLDEMNGFFG